MSAADVPLAVLLNVGDTVEITYAPSAGGVAQPVVDVKLSQGKGSPPLSTPASPVEPYAQDAAPAAGPAEAETGN